jgi:hypothetical protein
MMANFLLAIMLGLCDIYEGSMLELHCICMEEMFSSVLIFHCFPSGIMLCLSVKCRYLHCRLHVVIYPQVPCRNN